MAKERASDWAIVESASFEVSAGRRSAELPSTPKIKRYVAECREFLQAGTVPERKELVRNFVKGIKIDGMRCRFGTLSHALRRHQTGKGIVLKVVQSGHRTQTPVWPRSASVSLRFGFGFAARIRFGTNSRTKRYYQPCV